MYTIFLLLIFIVSNPGRQLAKLMLFKHSEFFLTDILSKLLKQLQFCANKSNLQNLTARKRRH